MEATHETGIEVGRSGQQANIRSDMNLEISPKQEPLSEAELIRIEALKRTIDEYYEKLPFVLRHARESQERCLSYLLSAESSLTPPVGRGGIIEARLNVTKVEIEIGRARSSNFSFSIVVAIVYMSFPRNFTFQEW